MKNVSHSVDVVKDCFGITEVRKNKTFNNNYNNQEDALNDNIEQSASGKSLEYHWQIVARILFIFAKLNPGQGYVQGMNEIIGPIYYVLANDPRTEWSEHTEADTFWCFMGLMSEIRDIFNKHADADRASGIVSRMDKFNNIVSKEDYQLYSHINLTLGIKPHFYAFRWITLLLSQEFPLPGKWHF